MKKLFALALALALSLSACGGKAGNVSSDTGSAGVALTPSITPADGWTQYLTTGVFYMYTDSDGNIATFAVYPLDSLDSSTFPTISDYGNFMLNALKGQDTDVSFTDLSQTSVNGMDASEFTVTLADGSTAMYIYVVKDSQVFNIQCSMEISSDKVTGDIQAMLNSFTLN